MYIVLYKGECLKMILLIDVEMISILVMVSLKTCLVLLPPCLVLLPKKVGYVPKRNLLRPQNNIIFCIFTDARVDSWLLMSSPWPTLWLTVGYLIVCHVGPKIMENKKPWDLRGFIIGYNFCLVLVSGYMFLEASVLNVLYNICNFI